MGFTRNHGMQKEVEQEIGNRAPYRTLGRSPFDVLAPTPLPHTAKGAPPFQHPEKFIEMLRTPFTAVAAAAAILVLPKVDQQRTILTIRNSSTSAGVLFIGLGFAPTGATDALFELAVGGQIIFDVAVPQDEVWLASTAGSLGVVGYSLAGKRLFAGRDTAGAPAQVKTGVVAKSGPIA